MNTNTFDVTAAREFAETRETALQNSETSSSQTLTAIILWLAVAIPMIWGVIKAWNEAQLMF